MRGEDARKYLMTFFIIGFAIGILYINTIGKEAVLTYEIFDKYRLQQYADSVLNRNKYMSYIAKLRLMPLVFLGILSITRLKKLAGIFFVVWTGLLTGIFITHCFIGLSISGVVLCLVGIIPQFICYSAAYIVLLRYMYEYPESRWNSVKTVFIILVMCIGIILEVYVHPVIMKLFIRTL